MTFEEYIQSLQGKQVAVIGIGVSNIPLIKLFLRKGIAVTACDKNDRKAFGNEALLDELEKMGAVLKLGPDYLDGLNQDVIFRSPGIRPDIPAFEAARAAGSEITSEMEVFFHLCPCKTIGVTGSDGKTTTTTIIARLMEAAGYRVHLGGQHRTAAAAGYRVHPARRRGGFGALLLPADDHGHQCGYCGCHQSGAQSSGCPQGHGGVYRGEKESLYPSKQQPKGGAEPGQRAHPRPHGPG